MRVSRQHIAWTVGVLLLCCAVIYVLRPLLLGGPSCARLINETGENLAGCLVVIRAGNETVLSKSTYDLSENREVCIAEDIYNVFIDIEWSWRGRRCTYFDYYPLIRGETVRIRLLPDCNSKRW